MAKTSVANITSLDWLVNPEKKNRSNQKQDDENLVTE